MGEGLEPSGSQIVDSTGADGEESPKAELRALLVEASLGVKSMLADMEAHQRKIESSFWTKSWSFVISVFILAGIGALIGYGLNLWYLNQPKHYEQNDHLVFSVSHHDVIEISESDYDRSQFSSWGYFELRGVDRVYKSLETETTAIGRQSYGYENSRQYVIDELVPPGKYQLHTDRDRRVAAELWGTGLLKTDAKQSRFNLDFGRYEAIFGAFLGFVVGAFLALFFSLYMADRVYNSD